ncbi:hypothetical protein [Nitrobacter winogradskyi]|nr:hypothetical protein [Nitrobacter winogradskyi]
MNYQNTTSVLLDNESDLWGVGLRESHLVLQPGRGGAIADGAGPA